MSFSHSAIAHALRIASARVDRDPSPAAVDAGNYRKGHLTYKGLDVTIENPKGSQRSGVDKGGKPWSVTMPAAYGYVKGSVGADKDHVDVYLGPDHNSDKVFVVDQVNAETGKFDEHKVMLSFPDKAAAMACYEKAFSDGKGKDRVGAVTPMTVAEFKDWLSDGDTKKPVGRFAQGGAVMPLIKSGSREAVSQNISEMERAGHPHNQAVAAALDTARRYQRRADGGATMPADGWMAGPSDEEIREMIQRRVPDWIGPPTQPLAPDAPKNGGLLDALRSWWRSGGDDMRRKAQQSTAQNVDEELRSSFVPVYAPATDAYNDYQSGHPYRAAVNGAIAAAEVGFPLLAGRMAQIAVNSARPMSAGAKTLNVGLSAPAAQFGIQPAQSTMDDALVAPLRRGVRPPEPTRQQPYDTTMDTRGLSDRLASYLETTRAEPLHGRTTSIPDPRALERDGSLMLLREPTGVGSGPNEGVPPSYLRALREFWSMPKPDQLHAKGGRVSGLPHYADGGSADDRPRVPMSGTDHLVPVGTPGTPDPQWPFFKPYDAFMAGMEAAGPMVLGPAGALTRGLKFGIESIPKGVAASGAGLAGMFALPSIASPETLEKGDPVRAEIEARQKSIAAAQAKLDKFATHNFPSTRARELTTQPIIDQMTADRQRIADLTAILNSESKRKVDEAVVARDKILGDAAQPFDKTFPTWSRYQAWMPAVTAGATALAMKSPGSVAEWLARSRWNEAVNRAIATTSPAVRERAVNTAKAFAEDWPKPSFLKTLGSYAAPVVIGGVEGAAMSNAPEAYNWLALPPDNPRRTALEAYMRALPEGHPDIAKTKAELETTPAMYPAREAARQHFTSSSVLGRLGTGALEGAGGALLGTTLGKAIGVPERALPRAETTALEALRASDAPSLSPTRSLTVLPPDQGGPPPPALPPPVAAGPGSGPPPTPALPPAGPVAGTTSSAVERTSLPAPPDVKVPRGHYWDENIGQTRHKTSGKFGPVIKQPTSKRLTKSDLDEGSDAAAAYFAKNPDALKGQKHGGSVGRGLFSQALGLARKYARGGAVPHAGPVIGHTGGRDDALPIDVRAGSFVIPADVVSGLPGAQGNTLAGMKQLEQVFGRAEGGPAYAKGGNVPIKISDGEYVLSPEQVARVGGGDVNKGHLILDKFVTAMRKQNIATLKTLPPPSK